MIGLNSKPKSFVQTPKSCFGSAAFHTCLFPTIDFGLEFYSIMKNHVSLIKSTIFSVVFQVVAIKP